MIMIGSYQFLVKDACSGMNSIFALSAIGVFYAYAFRWEEKFVVSCFCRDHSDHDRGELHSRAYPGFDGLLWRARFD